MLRLISTADLASLAEMRTAMADAMRANAGAAARAILRSRGLVPGPNAEPRTGPDRWNFGAKMALHEASDPTRENGK